MLNSEINEKCLSLLEGKRKTARGPCFRKQLLSIFRHTLFPNPYSFGPMNHKVLWLKSYDIKMQDDVSW